MPHSWLARARAQGGSPDGLGSKGVGRALLILLLLLAPVLPAQSSDFVRGDVNGDGSHSIADLAHLARYLQLGTSPPPCLDSADFDDNGQLDVIDLAGLLSYLFLSEGGATPAAPFPDSGPDPTGGDELSCIGGFETLPTGSELPHVFTLLNQAGENDGGFALAPGGELTRIPILLSGESPFGVSALTISLSFDPSIVSEAVIDFADSQPQASLADLMLSESSPSLPGRVYAFCALEVMSPITALSFPVEDGVVIGHLGLRLREDAPIGGTFSVHFATHPPGPDSPPVRNEIVKLGGLGVLYPEVHSLTIPIVEPASVFLRGDFDRNGVVSIADAIELAEYLFQSGATTPPCLDAADVNDDGRLDLADCVLLLQHLFGPPACPPPAQPFPCPGVDTTLDALPCL
ncbi:MAG: dockerin type I repeat-containing protein [Planctomycetota bacterium]|jgi:hypothetical protein